VEGKEIQKLLPKLPKVEALGLHKVREGLPVGPEWPEPVKKWLAEKWPGTPFPRSWGETAVRKLPLGLGEKVFDIIDSLGL